MDVCLLYDIIFISIEYKDIELKEGMNSAEYDTYFNHRWKEYSEACLVCPNALQQEFQVAVEMLRITESDRILNIPAAYNDIAPYFATHPALYDCLETSRQFARHANIPWTNWSSFPSETRYTKIISMASLHHLDRDGRLAFFRECANRLEEGGELLVADVQRGSPQDAWLNIFVDLHNSFGHKGIFWSAEDTTLFQEAGFSQVTCTEKEYEWTFTNRDELLYFTRRLFGIDAPISDVDLFQALQTYFSLRDYNIPWKLLYFRATKDVLIPSPFEEKNTDSLLQE